MLDGVERPAGIPRHRPAVAQPHRVALAVDLSLPRAIELEAPDATRAVEQRARVLARHPGLAVLRLTRVRRRPDVDVEIPVAAHRNPLGRMRPLSDQPGHHRIGCPAGFEWTGTPRPPDHGIVGGEVQKPVTQRDPRSSRGSEPGARVGHTVTGRVAQREHATLRAAQRQKDIAVRGDGDVPRTSYAVGDDQRAEPLRQRESGVVAEAGGA